MESLWRDTWASFKAVSGPVLTGAGFVIAIFGPLYLSGTSVQINIIWLVVGLLATLALTLTAANMVMVARRLARPDISRAKRLLVRSGTADEKQLVTLVMGRSRQFGLNVLVTIYHEESLSAETSEILEQAIGIGLVINTQDNGLIQVRVLREEVIHAQLWTRIRDSVMSVLRHVIIKPSIDFNAAGIEVRVDE